MARVIADPVQVLNDVFGYPEFRGMQGDIINSVINGDDVLALMKTSGGKSLCFQVPALCLSGTNIVISPLISLMKDQVDTLLRKGVRAGMVNSDMQPDEITSTLVNLSNGYYKIFYIAPERLADENFMALLAHIDVSFVAVDESHCVSMWGHDFRKNYTKLDERLTRLSDMKGYRLPRAAYTATATPLIKEDIKKQLGMNAAIEYISSFDRENLCLSVMHSNNKNNDLDDILSARKGQSGIVYCKTVKMVENIYGRLHNAGINVGMYHGRLPSDKKSKMQEDFQADEIQVMIATNAFGMGVDKANVRWVVHYEMSENLESYYQEVGRGGRDGLAAEGIMLYSKNDRRLIDFFHQINYPKREEVEAIRDALAIFQQPTAYDAGWLVGISQSTTVQEFQIDTIMQLLAEQGHIELLDVPEGQKAFAPIDLSKPVDMTLIEARAKIARENLIQMESFCNTNLCRKRNVLRYFGEKSAEHNCNSCDVCLGLNQQKNLLASSVGPDIVKGVISLVALMGSACVKSALRDVMLGVRNRVTEKYADNNVFGILSSKTVPEVESLITSIDKDGILIISRDRMHTVMLSERGKTMFANLDSLQVASRGVLDLPKKEPQGFDPKILKALKEFRERWGVELRQPSFAVLGDKAIEKLATEKPKTLHDLANMGVSKNKIEQFGLDLLRVIDRSGTKPEMEIQF